MNKQEQIRKKIASLETSIRLLEERRLINLELTSIMKKNPTKLKPEYAFESEPEYIEAIKKKWGNEARLQNIRISENIASLKEQISYLKQELVKNENKPKEVKAELKSEEKKPTKQSKSKVKKGE